MDQLISGGIKMAGDKAAINKQLEALTGFMRDDVKAFGLVASELKGTAFSPRHFRMRIAVHDFIKRSDLLEHYLSINAGGTPHSAEEIARVRGLLVESRNQ